MIHRCMQETLKADVAHLCVKYGQLQCICAIFYVFDKLILLQCICVLDYMSYYALLCVNLFA